MKTLFTAIAALSLFVGTSCKGNTEKSNEHAYAKPLSGTLNVAPSTPVKTTPNVIKVALLLDTSNSMDGLIDQAKAQLWELVNELGRAKCEGEAPLLNIALYEYGNARLAASTGYIRQISAFTEDLDELSQALFALTTNGGSEYCGQAMQTAIADLNWGKQDQDLNFIFIAGNEPFTQGPVHYKDAATDAKEREITINTIFCGNYNEGVSTHWKDGADLTNGNYLAIDHDRKTVHIPSPYDDMILQKNKALNKTYIAYGQMGETKMALQSEQDSNAAQYGSANAVKRAVAKSGRLYNNKSWDLVDAAAEEDFEYESLEETALPSEIKGKTKEEIKVYVTQKSKERAALQKEIAALNRKREAYVAQKRKEQGEEALGTALIKAIKKQAARKNYTFEKE